MEKLMIRDDGVIAHLTAGIMDDPRWSPFKASDDNDVEDVVEQDSVEPEFDVDSASKVAIEEYAESLGIALDRRKSLARLRIDLKEAIEGM
jgi:hypothetical protein